MEVNQVELAVEEYEEKPIAAEVDVVSSVVKKYERKPWALISVLQDIQEGVGYLPENILRRVADEMGVSLRQIYGVATFFKSLNLTPQGKHTITICLGTACHVRGAGKILSEVADLLDVEPGETTEDGEFTLRAVNCLGACAIGPVMVVDGKYYGEVSASRAKGLLAECRS